VSIGILEIFVAMKIPRLYAARQQPSEQWVVTGDRVKEQTESGPVSGSLIAIQPARPSSEVVVEFSDM
jgi:hypothetical protein